MKQSILLSQLINKSQQCQERAEEILDLSIEQLTKRPNPKAWNTLEVFEHLNYYIDIYNGYISQKATESLEYLKEMGTDAIAIVPYTGMRTLASAVLMGRLLTC